MPKKALRQGLRVSIKELKDLADKLVKEAKERNASIGLKDPKMLERGWIISIINKQPKCSDTWEIEKGREVKDISDTFDRLKRKMSGQEFKNRARAGWKIEKGKINKRFLEAMERMHAKKKKITPNQVNDLIQKVRYGRKKGKK